MRITKALTRRVEALERREPDMLRWHWIIGEEGEDQAEAIARHEREQGSPVGATDGVIFWRPASCAYPA